MEPGFQLEIIYRDKDLIEVRVSAWNGVFGGSSDVYLNKGDLGALAEKLRGFPSSHLDSRDYMLGTFDPESAGGGVSMRFHCIDQVGHAYLEVKIESNDDAVNIRQSAFLSIPIEASAVDSFVDGLFVLENSDAGVASLKGAVIVMA